MPELYSYSQSESENVAPYRNRDVIYFGIFRSKKAFIDAVIEAFPQRNRASRGWVSQRVMTGGADMLAKAMKAGEGKITREVER